MLGSRIVAPKSVVIGLLSATLATLAQSPAKFEVATIKPNKSDDSRVSGGFQPGGVYRVANYTLRALIAAAYLRPQINPDFLISGGPKWIDTDRFNVEAKADGDFPVVPGPESVSSPRRMMLQALLAERFQLRVHTGTMERPIYLLKLAKGDGIRGPQLTQATSDCGAPATRPNQAPLTGGSTCTPRIGPGLIDLHGATMAQFVGLLPRFVDRVVRDQTALSERLDLQLKWTPAPGEWIAPPIPGVAEAPAPDGPSIFTAIQEQLGLRLESSRGPVEVLVIDSAQQPSEN